MTTRRHLMRSTVAMAVASVVVLVGVAVRGEWAQDDARRARSVAPHEALRPEERGAAVARAVASVHHALPPGDDEVALVRRALRDLSGSFEVEAIERLLDRVPPLEDEEIDVARARFLLETGQYDASRRVAWAWVKASESTRSAWIKRWYDAHVRDLRIFAPLELVAAGEQVDEFIPIRRNTSSVLFRGLQDGETVVAFKPRQSMSHTNIRGELAAARLCPLIHCNLRIPRIRDARLSLDEYVELTGQEDLEATEAFDRARTSVLRVKDLDQRRYIFGVMKEWVGPFTKLRLEEGDSWYGLLRVGRTADELRSMTVEDGLDEFSWGWEIEDLSPEGATAYDLAHSISDMHVFDALIGNYDRFQTRWPGRNIHWMGGKILSIDQGASFLPNADGWAYEAGLRYMRRIQLFSRSTIDALRWMDLELIRPILLPPRAYASTDDEAWTQFLRRREEVLAYVDELVAEHGEEAVYVFD